MPLNHFFVVVDPATYQAARSSAFLTTEFAPFEARTTVRNDTSYTGIYWYGRRTYFELFEPGSQGPAGKGGLALGVEEPGASAVVRRRWEDAIGGAGGGPVTRKTETDEVPWFEMTYAREIPGLRVFLLEYHREFLARWYGELTKSRSITRADVLDRYVAKIGQSDRREKALLQDVVGLEIALEPADRETLVKQLRAAAGSRRTPGMPWSAPAPRPSESAWCRRGRPAPASSPSTSRCSTRPRRRPTASARPSCGSTGAGPARDRQVSLTRRFFDRLGTTCGVSSGPTPGCSPRCSASCSRSGRS